MWFWTYMVIMDLLVPFLMIGLGKSFLKKAPKEINALYGYRTTRSMKNRDTWEFAHHYCGKIWHVCGWILLPVSLLPMFFVIGQSDDTIGYLGGFIELVQVLFLIGSVIPTEIALKKNFDQNGNKRRPGGAEDSIS